jgi:hypothetical protein
VDFPREIRHNGLEQLSGFAFALKLEIAAGALKAGFDAPGIETLGLLQMGKGFGKTPLAHVDLAQAEPGFVVGRIELEELLEGSSSGPGLPVFYLAEGLLVEPVDLLAVDFDLPFPWGAAGECYKQAHQTASEGAGGE